MARTFKITGYLVDPNDNYNAEDIQRILERYADLNSDLKIVSSPEWKWDDNCPENFKGCTTEKYEKRFNSDVVAEYLSKATDKFECYGLGYAQCDICDMVCPYR